MILQATYTAILPGLTSSFLATGGAGPYTYTILEPKGSGGTIEPLTGLYTAPLTIGKIPDVVQAVDTLGATATLPIMIGNPLMFVCDIIQKGMGLDSTQVYLYNQKINIPIDSQLYIAVGLLTCKPFANTISYDSGGHAIQSTNFQATLSINIMSRGTDARDRKEEVIMALNSTYAQQQQEKNSFHLARISSSFVNLSEVEGNAIPYRFNISVNMIYSVEKVREINFYNEFSSEETIDS